MFPGAAFETLHFLCNLKRPARGQALKLTLPICKVQRKKFVNMFPGAVFTIIHFLCNLQIYPISKSVHGTRVKRAVLGGKHSSSFCPFVGYGKNIL